MVIVGLLVASPFLQIWFGADILQQTHKRSEQEENARGWWKKRGCRGNHHRHEGIFQESFFSRLFEIFLRDISCGNNVWNFNSDFFLQISISTYFWFHQCIYRISTNSFAKRCTVCRWLQTCCFFPRGIAWCVMCPIATGWRSLRTPLSTIQHTPNSARRTLSSTRVIRFYFHCNHTNFWLDHTHTPWMMNKLQL